MSTAKTSRRVRVERGIYRRPDGRLELGWRDAQGKLRWRVVEGGITAARSALVQEHAKRNRGEAIAADPRLTFNAAADAWQDARMNRLRPATQSALRSGAQASPESTSVANASRLSRRGRCSVRPIQGSSQRLDGVGSSDGAVCDLPVREPSPLASRHRTPLRCSIRSSAQRRRQESSPDSQSR